MKVCMDMPAITLEALLPTLRTKRQQRRVVAQLKTLTRERRAVMHKLSADLAQQAAQLGIENRLAALDDAAGVPLRKYERRLNALKRGQ